MNAAVPRSRLRSQTFGRVRESWFRVRDSLLSNDRFHAFATRFPLTRPLARRRVRTLFDLCAGFVYSQVLLACVELKLFERLRKGPRSVADLSSEVGVDAAPLQRLMVAASALRLLRRAADSHGVARYGLGDLGAALLGNPGVVAMIEHHRLLYQDLADPVAMLRGQLAARQSDAGGMCRPPAHHEPASVLGGSIFGAGDASRVPSDITVSGDPGNPQGNDRSLGDERGLSGFWPYATSEQPDALATERIDRYTRLMAASQDMIARQVIAAYPLDRHSCLLDVGGGNGTFVAHVARAHADLALALFDLPSVAGLAVANLSAEGLVRRVRVHGGSFTTDALPAGADIISLVRIIHDHDDAIVRRLLQAVYQALPDGGTLLIAEPMSGTRGGEPIADAYFGMYLQAMGSGRPRHFDELAGFLTDAGFDAPRTHATHVPELLRVISCRKSAKATDSESRNAA